MTFTNMYLVLRGWRVYDERDTGKDCLAILVLGIIESELQFQRLSVLN